MLAGSCRARRGPEHVDKFSKTRENRHSRGKRENQDMLTSLLSS